MDQRAFSLYPTSNPHRKKKSKRCVLLGKIIGKRAVSEYCSCKKCAELPTAVENVCCRETIEASSLYANNIKKYICGLRCICQSPFVRAIVLNQSDLELFSQYSSWKNKDKENGKRRVSKIDPKRHLRFAAYKKLTFFFHGELGMDNRVELPSCLVTFVRKQYPSKDDDYVGFKSSDWMDE